MTDMPTLRAVILRMLERGKVFRIGIGLLENSEEDDKLTETDRAFLAKWLAFADDSIWSEILDTGHPPAVFPHYTFPFLVQFALRINRQAESVRFGGDSVFAARQKRRSGLLELADASAELAHFFREQAKISYLVDEYATELRPLPELIALHDALARYLRKSAGPALKPTITPPRQDRRNGRSGLRKRRLFITLMSDCLWRFYDQKVGDPFHIDSLVAFARIEFPDVDYVTLQKALEPTTREGRRRSRQPEPNQPPPLVETRR
jgi:hypothetical protein